MDPILAAFFWLFVIGFVLGLVVGVCIGEIRREKRRAAQITWEDEPHGAFWRRLKEYRR